MQDFIAQFNTPTTWMLVGLVAVMAVVWLPELKGAGGKVFGMFGGAAAPADDDVADLAAAKRLAARFERTKCPEGKAAVNVCLEHFFHSGA
jgi:hypothetical protein